MADKRQKREGRGNVVGGAISVGGNATGSVLVSGKNNEAIMTFGGPNAEERQNVLEALAAIQVELAKLSGPRASSAETLAGAAVDEAKKEQPNKDEIGSLLGTALKTARETAEFAGVAVKLAPYVKTAAGWLGGQWTGLVSLVG